MNCVHRALAIAAVSAAIIPMRLPVAEAGPMVFTDPGAFAAAVAAAGITGMGMVDFNMAPFTQPGEYNGTFPGGMSTSSGFVVVQGLKADPNEQVWVNGGSDRDQSLVFSHPVAAFGIDLVTTVQPDGAPVEFTADSLNGPLVGSDKILSPPSFYGIVSPSQPIGQVFMEPSILANLGEVQGFDNIQYPGGPGSSQTNPITPIGTCGQAGCFIFVGMPAGGWYDPALANAYTFTTQGGTFTSINDFPTGFSQPFIVSVGGVELGSFGPAQSVDFPNGGVTQFTISGIDPAVDGTDPTSFPIDLSLSTLGESFTMQAITSSPASVPEPSTLALTLTGLGMAGAFARYQRRRSRAASNP